MTGAGSHLWIRRVTFSGGFLDGLELQLSPGLNCLIGARGAGKTTVLEAIRFALDRLPDPVKAKDRRKQIDRLLESNLGSVSLELVSADGACYRIERRVGEAPAVFDGSGERLQVDLSRDAVLGLDGHSQSEIESIAGDAYLQLRLIDARAAGDLRGVEDELALVEGDLRRVAEEVCRTRRHVADLTQETRDLPEVESRLAELSVQGSDERADRLRHEQELKTLRDSEQRQLERLGRAARQGLEAIEAARARLGVDLRAIEADAPGEVPNLDLLDTVQRWAQEGLEEGLRGLEAAQRSLTLLSEQVAQAGQDLAARHSAQERGYEQALAASQGDPGKARERARLASRREELLRRRADQDRSQAALEQALSRRAELRLRLADLRQRRLGLRQRMAGELNELLGPASGSRSSRRATRTSTPSCSVPRSRGPGPRGARRRTS